MIGYPSKNAVGAQKINEISPLSHQRHLSTLIDYKGMIFMQNAYAGVSVNLK